MSFIRRLMQRVVPQSRLPKPVSKLGIENLEERTMLSSIVWTNRGGPGNDSDFFGAAFGANAPAARVVIDNVLDHWERIIPSFNTAATGSVPADTINVQFTMEELPAGTNGAASFPQVDATGRPRGGSIRLDFNGSPNDAVTSGWFVDPTPNDNSEFLLTEITSGASYSATIGRAHSGSPAASKLDLYTIASHELYHLLGLSSSSSLRLFTTPGLVADTGIPQNPGSLWSFNGPSTQFLMTSRNGFNAEPRPSHMADPSAVMPANAQFPNGLRGAGGLGSPATGNGIRILPSLTDSLFLRDAYGYTTVDPEQFGTFYSVLNSSTGELTVRGQFGNLFNDRIVISQSGGTITTSVDNGADSNPNGTGVDAYLTSYPASNVTSIKVIGTDADSIVVGRGIAVPISVIGKDGNFNSLTLEGNNANETFNLNDTTISVFTTGLQSTTTMTVAYSNIHGIGFSGFDGADTMNYNATAAGQVIFNGGLGADTFHISPTARNLANAQATFLSVNGQEGTDALNLNDVLVTSGQTFDITTNRVNRNGSQLVNFATIENATLNAGQGSDTINVQSTLSSTAWTINGANGNEQFNVGLNNSMAGVLGNLSLIGQAGTNTAQLNDLDAATANNYTVTSTQVQRSNGPAIVIAGVNLILQAPNTANTIRVESLSSTRTYQLNANGGTDVIEITPTTQLFSNLVSADLLVRGGAGLDSLIVHDEARATGRSYTGFGSQIVAGLSSDNIKVRWDTTEGVTFNAGSGGDLFRVEGGGGSSLPTVINGGAGADHFDVTSSTQTFDSVFGRFTFNGGADSDQVSISDRDRTTATHVVFTNTSISRPGTTRPDLAINSIETQLFNGGEGADTLNASAYGGRISLFGNNGPDVLTGGSNNDILTGDAGNDTLIGNDGADQLFAGTGIDNLQGGNGDDTASNLDAGDIVDLGAGEDGILIRGTNKSDVIRVGRQIGLNGAQAVIQINGQTSIHDYLNGETVTVFGGNGNDTITLDPTAGVTWKAIFHGELGGDTLVGSSRGDILIGGDGNDRLYGGGGSDELYGDAGNDYLQGDSGDDQLFGGDGNDQLLGNQGVDHLHGGNGVDTYDGGADADWVYADADGVVDFIYIDDDDVLVSLEGFDKVFA